ncbi:MAG: hypothetical protein M3209_01715 [Acidobacteriota bacterium]|nr:hypothetical protein [Acidobacteriota bacterium]
MKKRARIGVKSILTLVLLLAVSITVWAEWRQKIIQVRFAKGGTSAQYKDILRGRIWHIYKLRAKSGQTMRVELQVNENDYVGLQVKNASGLVLQSSDNSETGDSWENTLKRTGEYQIWVTPPDTTENIDLLRYGVKITIE